MRSFQYHVVWSIDIEADTPEAAAQAALAIQRDPASIATCFAVLDDVGEVHHIDLNPEHG